jgi:hypothetical protein
MLSPPSSSGYSEHADRLMAAFAGRVRKDESITEADSFLKQWEYITAKDRFNVQWSGRRAAKTSGSRIKTAMLNEAQPGRRVLYIHQTSTNAEQQFFRPLVDTDPPEADQKKYRFRALSLKARHVPHRADNNDLMVFWTNGSYLRCMGCNNLAEVKKKLGEFWHEIIIDEMQSYPDEVLYELIDRAILPTMIDRSGSATFQGTPPVTKAGFWYDMLTKSTFRKFHWTLFDNPYIDHDAVSVYAARGIKPEDPIYRREVLGEICVDPNAVVFKYDSPRNDLPVVANPSEMWECDGFRETAVAEPHHPAWRHAMGVDLGFSDHDAIVVLGWRMDDPKHRLFERWSWQRNHLDYLAMAEVFKKAAERWQPQQVCADTGGHGARKIVESLRNVFSIYKFALKPSSVLDSIALVNDELRTGRMLVDPNGLIAHDARLVVWKQGQHEVEISDTFHSDVMAALRYAHSVAYHHQSEAAAPEYDEDDNSREARTARFIRQWEHRQRVERDPYGPSTRRQHVA